LGAASSELTKSVGVEPAVQGRQLERVHVTESFKHLAQTLARRDLWRLAQPTQAGTRPQFRIDLQEAIQPRPPFGTQRLNQQALDASLGLTLHGPHQSLERRDARRNDLLRSQTLHGKLNQRQRPVAFECKRQQFATERVEFGPAAVVKAELTP
jgi:hypothetical protein